MHIMWCFHLTRLFNYYYLQLKIIIGSMQNNTKHPTTSTTAYHDYSNSQLNLSNLFDRNSPDSSQNLPKFLFGGENQYQVSSRRRFGVSRTSASST